MKKLLVRLLLAAALGLCISACPSEDSKNDEEKDQPFIPTPVHQGRTEKREAWLKADNI